MAATDTKLAPAPKEISAESLQQARNLIERTWRQGRRVLVVIGAGASKAKQVPDMNWAFDWLAGKLTNLAATLGGADKRNAQELADWVGALRDRHAPRSIAAMALGTLQRAHRGTSDLEKAYAEVWSDFSSAFVEELAATATAPTVFHKMVAEWATEERADLVSLNFDGLTCMALTDEAGKHQGIILGEPREIEGFFLGEQPAASAELPALHPVVKIWGDVFHAVCTNRRCPEHAQRIPVYDFAKNQDLKCRVCGVAQHLQIYFAGYEEKEQSVGRSLEQLQRYVAPRAGCIVTAGFSGAWDEALVNFLAELCKDLQSEASDTSAWINVDPASSPPLHQELVSYGITPIHCSGASEELAKRIKPQVRSIKNAETTEKAVLPSGKDYWAMRHTELLKSSGGEALTGEEYLKDFELVQQLGIKTKIALAAAERPDADIAAHNRRLHSYGACELALGWFQRLSEQVPGVDRERLARVVMMAVLHHDLGHIPFTHLAEEMFEEVHWTVRDGSAKFHHDQAVFASAMESHREAAKAVAEQVASEISVNGEELLAWAEGAIEGRSGNAWLDAIVNSPLDCDKLDYVFRDCHFLGQDLHVPSGEPAKSIAWLNSLFSHTRVLPSGIVALEGTAGEQARDFLEERRWLYKHQYLVPGFRMIERLARAVILNWLLYEVTKSVIFDDAGTAYQNVGDTSAHKGRQARDLLWKKLKEKKSESDTLLELCDQLANEHKHGLPAGGHLSDWAKRCKEILNCAFNEWSPDGGCLTLEEHLVKNAGVTASDFFYAPVESLWKVREVARRLEQLHPLRALVDFTLTPRMLAYPDRRQLRAAGPMTGECFCVSDRDPDRWGRVTGKWVPLSESVFADEDRKRWARVSVLSPFPQDPAVPQVFDHLRNECRRQHIECKEVDPDERWAGSGAAHGAG